MEFGHSQPYRPRKEQEVQGVLTIQVTPASTGNTPEILAHGICTLHSTHSTAKMPMQLEKRCAMRVAYIDKTAFHKYHATATRKKNNERVIARLRGRSEKHCQYTTGRSDRDIIIVMIIVMSPGVVRLWTASQHGKSVA